MRAPAIAQNYAEALFALGEKTRGSERYAALLEALAAAVDGLPTVQAVLMSPKVTKTRKAELLVKSLPGAPREFGRWLQAVVKRGRQLLLGDMAEAYVGLLDQKFNRVRAGVTVAREPDAKLKKSIEQALVTLLGKDVLAAYEVQPVILGGAVIRVGDRVMDGSVRRKLVQLRRQLLAR